MKDKNYTKEYLMKSIKYLRGEIQQTKFRIQSLEVQIQKEKSKLMNTYVDHDHLWFLRDKLKYEKKIMLIYKNDLIQKDRIMNRLYNKQENRNHVDTSNMTTMEVLGMNHPEFKCMDEFFKMIQG